MEVTRRSGTTRPGRRLLRAAGLLVAGLTLTSCGFGPRAGAPAVPAGMINGVINGAPMMPINGQAVSGPGTGLPPGLLPAVGGYPNQAFPGQPFPIQGLPTQTGPAGGSRVGVQGDALLAVSTIEDFWTRAFAAKGARFQPVGQVFSYTPMNTPTCGRSQVPPNNALYCTKSDYVAFDSVWAGQQTQSIGPIFMYFLLGHEYSHAVQERQGIDHQYAISQELQADCYAGAYLGGESALGALRLGPNDLQALRNMIEYLGDQPNMAWFTPMAHGTAQQRYAAVMQGFNQGLNACAQI